MRSTCKQAAMVAGVLALCAFSRDANAVTIGSEVTADFTDFSLPTSFNAPWASGSLVQIVTPPPGSLANQYRSPFENAATPGSGATGWDDAQHSFTAIQAGGYATYDFSSAVTSLQFLWGSPDAYNTITFWSGLNGTGANEGSFTGSAMAIHSVGHDLVTFDGSATPFLSIVLTTTQNAFELADLTVPGGGGGSVITPLPAALPLFAGGLGLMGWVGRRKKRGQASALAA